MSAEGHLIAGRYRLEQRIGSGAMGVVWRAVDERLQRTVAVKQLLLQPGYTQEETEEARQRSMREGRIAARLQHQNAIAVFDVAEDEGQPVLVMEYLPSRSLASVLTDQGVLPPQEVARIGAQVAGALSAAHMAGIVHRDLKPGNILLGDNGLAKITDFGISRAIGDVSVTKSGILAGTPAYLSPEVALGRDPAPASDVFSLGSTLYAALEGGPPFGVDENAISLLHRVARGEVDPPRQAGPMTPVLMRLLRADPVDRPTMAQAQGMLQAVADGRPVPGPAGPPPSRGQQPAAQPRTRVQGPPQQDSGGTRVGAPVSSGPYTRVADAPENGNGPANRRRIVVSVLAVLVAILVGVLVANAFSGGDGKGSAQPERPAPTSAPAPAPPTTSSPEPTTQAPTTTSSATRTTSSAPPTSAGSAPHSEAEKEDKGKRVSSKDLEKTVEEYYSLVREGDLDDAWKLLGPGLKAQGKKSYEDFWNSIEDLRIVRGPKAAGSAVIVDIQFTKDDKRYREVHRLGMAAQGDQPLINSDATLMSRTG